MLLPVPTSPIPLSMLALSAPVTSKRSTLTWPRSMLAGSAVKNLMIGLGATFGLVGVESPRTGFGGGGAPTFFVQLAAKKLRPSAIASTLAFLVNILSPASWILLLCVTEMSTGETLVQYRPTLLRPYRLLVIPSGRQSPDLGAIGYHPTGPPF